jgi:hypothetical protein
MCHHAQESSNLDVCMDVVRILALNTLFISCVPGVVQSTAPHFCGAKIPSMQAHPAPDMPRKAVDLAEHKPLEDARAERPTHGAVANVRIEADPAG